MCEYCEKEKVIFEKEFLYEGFLGWCGDKKVSEVIYNDTFRGKDHVFIDDRGYLRFVDKDDSMCLDHGEKIEINYCPMCGEPFR